MQLKISQKGLLIVCIPLFFEAIFMLLMMLLLNQINNEIKHEETARSVLSVTHHLGRKVVNGSVVAAAARISPVSDSQAQFIHYFSDINSDIAKLRALLGNNSSELPLVDEMASTVKEIMQIIRSTTDTRAAKIDLKTLYHSSTIQQSAACIAQFNMAMHDLVSHEEEAASLSLNGVSRTKKTIELLLLVGVIVSILMTVLLTIFFTRNIAWRIHNLALNAAALGQRRPLNIYPAGNDELTELDVALQRTDAELAQLEKARQRLVAFVGHELKTPLTTLHSIFSLLDNGVLMPLNSPAQAAVDKANANLDEASSLIADLIDIEKMEGGKFQLVLSDVDVSTLIDAAVYKSTASNLTSAALQLSLEDMIIRVDRDRLCRALANIIRNSAARTAAGGVIEIKVKQAGNDMELVIKDTGSPLHQSLQKCIFDRNQFTDENDSLDMYINEALPLIISRMTVEQHGGSFTIKSGVELDHTEFICYLPSVAEMDFSSS